MYRYNYSVDYNQNIYNPGLFGNPVYYGNIDEKKIAIKEMYINELYILLLAQNNKYVVNVICVKPKNEFYRYPVVMEKLDKFNMYDEDATAIYDDNTTFFTGSEKKILDQDKINNILQIFYYI